ncbi:unnamed protein product [Owenia fusiformis]|uniref:Uncharacterized protein n=1 Tax=Owenia fusiformis TaxID=6347 RepID=A0A8J1UK66_OWEFU|nr:unnamed protein product [Owenia fusiformis]
MAAPNCQFIFAFIFMTISMVSCENVVGEASTEQEFCPFFNNRAPKPQPHLKNCTWYKENSCCLQREISATFGKVKPLQGASEECQRYVNYVMCYMCSPNQYLFYSKERLTVCEEFCDKWYEACKTAILKGSRFEELYQNGREFCEKRRFIIDAEENGRCFTFSDTLARSSGKKISPNPLLFVASFLLLHMCYGVSKTRGNTPVSQTKNKSIKDKTRQSKSSQTIIIFPKRNTLHNRIQFSASKPWTEAVLFSILFALLYFPNGSLAFSEKNIKVLAKFLSDELLMLEKDGLRGNAIQELYDKATYSSETLNAKNKVTEVKEKLGKYFTMKKQLLMQLAGNVTRLHDEWYTEEINNSRRPAHLSQLAGDVFIDADSEDIEDHLHYDSDFQLKILLNQSVVKIADSEGRGLSDVVDTVSWTAGLDRHFKDARAIDKDIRWQYFGSNTGIHRVFPGHEWSRNFIGFHDDYDPRTRPWYLAATSGPKDIVLILDASSSMAQSNAFNRMKSVALKLISTFTRSDSVNVIVSRSPHWDATGRYFDHRTEVLSCVKDRLVPASTKQRRAWRQSIENLQVRGGSDHTEAFETAFSMLHHPSKTGCQSIVVFITDGSHQDPQQRCSSGAYRYDSDGNREWEPGSYCQYDYNQLLLNVDNMQEQLIQKARIFTFHTATDTDEVYDDVQFSNSAGFPGLLACYSNGIMATITNEENPYKQLFKYFTYLATSSARQEVVWTAPYIDAGGLGLMLSATVSVYSNITGRHLGVVGLDSTLANIETMLLNEVWGSVYSFMINQDNQAIVHPLIKSSAELLDDPVFVDISKLETLEGEPNGFTEVLSEMKHGRSGDIRIHENARRAVSIHNALVWRDLEYSRYVFAPIPDSEYSVAFSIGPWDEDFTHVDDPILRSNKSYLHQLLSLGTNHQNESEWLQELHQELSPITDHPQYKGMTISKAHSTVQLSARNFCDPKSYLELHVPDLLQTQHHLASVGYDEYVLCSNGLYRSTLRADVKITSFIEELWRERPLNLQDQIAWSYIGTRGGVMRIYPGMEFQQDYDATRRPWYNRALANRGLLVMSSVYRDAPSSSNVGLGKVVTMSKAIHQVKSNIGYHCKRIKKGQGCDCTSNEECHSGFCDKLKCAHDVIEAVAAIDLRYEDFQSLTYKILDPVIPGHSCNTTYECNGGYNCQTRCYIIDDVGDLVLDPEFEKLPEEAVLEYEHLSLAKTHGTIFSQLIKRGVYMRKSTLDYQAACTISSEETPVKPIHNQATRGPIPPFKNKYACTKEIIHYTINKTVLDMNQGLIGGLLDDDPCARGSYFFAQIDGSNVYLLVLKDYYKLPALVNLNCLISNRVHAPGAFKLTEDVCDEHSTYSNMTASSTCPKLKTINVECGYVSGANSKIQAAFLVLILTVLLSKHLCQ